MENDEIINIEEFVEKVVNLDDIYFDPNNPRFYGKEKTVSDNRIMEESVQANCFELMRAFYIRDLKENIKRVGFLPIDKIVVRPIIKSDKYVVVEGNRRLAALKLLKKEHISGEIELSDEILKSIMQFTVYVYTGKELDIAWIIQGIRHISGVKNWKPFQQAKLLTKLVKERNVKIEDAGKSVGIGSIKAARLMRSYYAYEQSTKDEDFGEYVDEDDFSYFQEAVFTMIDSPMQQWLDWDEKEKSFKNKENLKKYLSWFVKIEGKQPKVNRALDVRDIITRAIVSYPSLFKKFEVSEDMQVSRLHHEMWIIEEEPKEIADWLNKLKEANITIGNLPDVRIKMSSELKTFIDQLTDLDKIIKAHLKALEK